MNIFGEQASVVYRCVKFL